MIFGFLMLLLLFPILRLVFGLAGWLLGLVGTLVIGAIVLLAFAALLKFVVIAGGIWASKALLS